VCVRRCVASISLVHMMKALQPYVGFNCEWLSLAYTMNEQNVEYMIEVTEVHNVLRFSVEMWHGISLYCGRGTVVHCFFLHSQNVWIRLQDI